MPFRSDTQYGGGDDEHDQHDNGCVSEQKNTMTEPATDAAAARVQGRSSRLHPFSFLPQASLIPWNLGWLGLEPHRKGLLCIDSDWFSRSLGNVIFVPQADFAEWRRIQPTAAPVPAPTSI